MCLARLSRCPPNRSRFASRNELRPRVLKKVRSFDSIPVVSQGRHSMKKVQRRIAKSGAAGLVAVVLAMRAGDVRAQSSSLFNADLPQDGPQLTLANTSWLYQALEPPKQIRLNDII